MTTVDLQNTDERTIVDLRRLDVPGAKVLGRYRYLGPHNPLAPHRHPGMMEICYLHRGKQHYEVEGKNYHLEGGDAFVTFPGERHSTGPTPEDRGVLYWLILRMDPLPAGFMGQAGVGARALIRQLQELPRRQFHAPREVHRLLEELLVVARPPLTPLASLEARSLLLRFLLNVVHASRRAEERERPDWLHPVLDLMAKGVGENLQVSDFAEKAGLSVSRFKTRFRETMGMPPGDYFLRQRIERAQDLLMDSRKSITRVAMDLGFSSSQNFATSFRRLTGQTASAWRTHKRVAA